MPGLGDRLQQFVGKTRFVVCRIFIHLAGSEAAPILGVLNQAARDAVTAQGDLDILGEGLIDICQTLLQNQNIWQSASNEGDIFWDEGEAGDYVAELFADSAQRYLSFSEEGEANPDDPLMLRATRNIVTMIAVAFVGEVPELETNLAEIDALETGLKALISLQYQGKFQAIQVHYSPAQFGDELTDEQLLLNFPELIPL